MNDEKALQLIKEAIAKKTTVLDLNGNQLTELPKEIGELKNLTLLNLRENQLTELPKKIAQLKSLAWLGLSSNQLTTLPKEIGELKNLTWLDLGGNQLTELPKEIGELKSLTRLDLSSNQLTELPKEIGELKNLTWLDLGGNQLTELPKEIGELKNLTLLDLRENQLTELPKEIAQFKSLTMFFLSNNQLATFPKEIGEFKSLTDLYLSENQLTELTKEIGELKSLTTLYLRKNQLATLPKEIGELKSLTRLYLSGNQLTELPKEIGELKNLTWLDLGGNQLATFPKEIAELKNLTQLDLRGNPVPILPDVLERINEPATIINSYLSVIGGQTRPLNEAKVLVVGEAKVGKTSLMKVLVNGQQAFNPQESQTHEINIQNWNVTADGEAIKLNLWDFGGQEIYHSTHRVFLTERSLYILVLNCRDSEEQNRLEYWLKIIQSYGGNSPVIIVGNHADQQPLDINRSGLLGKYPNIKKIVETSCEKYSGIDELKAEIAEIISEMRRVQDPLPVSWFQVKEKLEAMQLRYDYMSYNDFLQMCIKENILNEGAQKALLATMHILGVALNYRDDPSLNVLNPLWITKGVYGIITNPKILTEDNGMLEREKLKGILDQAKYPESSHELILNMMCRLELCFPTDSGKRYLIPDLLRKDEIDTGDWSDALKFRYDYKILPQSIISRFIVRASKSISKKTYWRYGVKLVREGNYALVKADREEGKIYISINGTASTRRSFLSIIRSIFEDIHKDFSDDFEVVEMVPLPDNPDEAIPYQHLLNLERARQATGNLTAKNGALILYEVRKLLNGIQAAEDRREDFETMLKQGKNIARQNLEIVLPESLKSEDSKTKELENVKLRLDEKAGKYADNILLLTFTLVLISYLAVVSLIYYFGWDTMEKWTYIVGVGTLVLAYGYFVVTLQEFSPKDIYQKLISSKKKKLYEELALEYREELPSGR
jgi:internalin A